MTALAMTAMLVVALAGKLESKASRLYAARIPAALRILANAAQRLAPAIIRPTAGLMV